MDLAQYIRNVPDFPKPGIQFKDITTLLMGTRVERRREYIQEHALDIEVDV